MSSLYETHTREFYELYAIREKERRVKIADRDTLREIEEVRNRLSSKPENRDVTWRIQKKRGKRYKYSDELLRNKMRDGR